MKVIGRMFRKKLIELLTANEEERAKLDWFAKTKAKEAAEAKEIEDIRKLAEEHTMLDKEGRKIHATNMFYMFHRYYKEK